MFISITKPDGRYFCTISPVATFRSSATQSRTNAFAPWSYIGGFSASARSNLIFNAMVFAPAFSLPAINTHTWLYCRSVCIHHIFNLSLYMRKGYPSMPGRHPGGTCWMYSSNGMPPWGIAITRVQLSTASCAIFSALFLGKKLRKDAASG